MVKKVMSITIDEKIFFKWKKFTNENFINNSKLIEKLLQDYMKKRRAI